MTNGTAPVGEDWQAEVARLYGNLDSDPAGVLAEARTWMSTDCRERVAAYAGLAINAGELLGDSVAVQEGLDALKALDGPSQIAQYNHANGLIALATLDSPSDDGWLERTRDIRYEARTLLRRVASDSDADPYVASQAMTNLGNQLSLGRRFVEAYDAFRAALKIDLSNGVAAMNAARELRYAVESGLSGPEGPGVHDALVAMAKANLDGIQERAGSHARSVAERLKPFGGGQQDAAHGGPSADAYERFVVDNHLHLSMGVESHHMHLCRWDNLQIHTFTEPIGVGGAEVPPIFAMLNTVKQSYVLARDMVYESTTVSPSDQVLYSDTLDYAEYGPSAARLVEGLRLTASSLDQIAVAANEVLGQPVRPKKVYFSDYWRQSKVVDRYGAWGDPFFVALSEAAADWAGGMYSNLRVVRNVATHRYVVLHDEGGETRARSTEAVDHFARGDFHTTAIDALRLTRAALIYLVGFIELQSVSEGDVVPMVVPSQHDIRGYDDM